MADRRLPHPVDLEVRDFLSYDLILDLRSVSDWLDDHVPGALCRPALRAEDEQCLVAKFQAGETGVNEFRATLIHKNIRPILSEVRDMTRPDGTVLVYCARGGLRSQVTCELLMQTGVKVEVLRGGWTAYRRWVESALDAYVTSIDWQPLSTELSDDVSAFQVIDMEAILASPSMMLFARPDGRIPGPLVESELLQALRQVDRDQPAYYRSHPLTSPCLDSLPGCLQRLQRRRPFRYDPFSDRQ